MRRRGGAGRAFVRPLLPAAPAEAAVRGAGARRPRGGGESGRPAAAPAPPEGWERAPSRCPAQLRSRRPGVAGSGRLCPGGPAVPWARRASVRRLVCRQLPAASPTPCPVSSSDLYVIKRDQTVESFRDCPASLYVHLLSFF